MTGTPLPATTHIGFVHLRVRSRERALDFYRDLLGFREIDPDDDTHLALSATGDAPPHIILNVQPDAVPKPAHSTGLYHVAIRVPERAALADLLRRLVTYGYPLQGAADHGVSEALYLADPDGNGLELYVDRPRNQWAWAGSQVQMRTDPLDADDLLAQATAHAWTGIDFGADIGHVHLHVSDLARAEVFWCEAIGFDVVQRSYPGALFVSAGAYHHHLGLNIWAGQGAPPPPPDAVGLEAFSLVLPDSAARERVLARLDTAGIAVEATPDGPLARDRDGNAVVLALEGANGD